MIPKGESGLIERVRASRSVASYEIVFPIAALLADERRFSGGYLDGDYETVFRLRIPPHMAERPCHQHDSDSDDCCDTFLLHGNPPASVLASLANSLSVHPPPVSFRIFESPWISLTEMAGSLNRAQIPAGKRSLDRQGQVQAWRRKPPLRRFERYLL
jgi:hypothetical protein